MREDPRAQVEERKYVTILFADVVASTALSGRVDPEQLREQMARFFSMAREEIERYGGTVEKFIGDAVMAVFGLPVVHEEDPERAVKAALAIRDRIHPHVDAGTMSEIRIGISTGEVVANPQASEKGEFLVTGEVVNLSARLQQHAAPGQVLVGESTHAATAQAFEYRAVPPKQVKGKLEPLIAFECVGLRIQPGLPPDGRLTGPMVGRGAELSVLRAALERVLGGQGAMVAIIGEAGIGKSRLLAEARRRVEGSTLRWLVGRAPSFSQPIRYWPFLEILRQASGIVEGDDEVTAWSKLEHRIASVLPDQLAEIAPYLGMLLGLDVKAEWQERVRYLDGDAMGRQVYRSSRLFFEHLAREGPVALVFEDMHWMDPSSAGLLEHLLPLVETAPLLICGASRTEAHTPAAGLRELALRAYPSRYSEILLSPLPPADGASLVRHLFQVAGLPPRAEESILQKTGGNPLFIEEVVRSLIDARAMARDAVGRRHVRAPADEIAIPDTLRGVIMARIDRLDPDSKEVLKTAAVIGRSFFHRVLQAITEDGRDLDRHLARLQRMDLILQRRHVPEMEYVFKHALTQETVYESILLRRRRELHHRAGEMIERLYADRLEEFYGALAYHFARAEDWTKAQEYLYKAGDQASRVAADAEALTLYQQAAAAYERVFGERWDPLQRAALDRKIGEALFRRGDHQQALEYFHRALTYLGTPFPASRSAATFAIVQEIMQQAGHRLLPWLFLRDAGRRPNASAEERCRLYEAMGWIDYFRDPQRVILEALLLLNVGEQQALALWVATGRYGLGLICEFLPLHSLAEFYHSRAVALAEETRHPLALGVTHLGFGLYQLHTGRWTGALGHFTRSVQTFRDAGDLRRAALATTLVAWVLRITGALASSLQHSGELLRIGQEAGDPQVLAWGHAEQGRVFLQTGALDEAVVHLREAAALANRVPDYVWVVDANSCLATCCLRQGKLQEALELTDLSVRLADAHDVRGYNRTLLLTARAEVCLATAERADPAQRALWFKRARQACRTLVKQGRIDAEAVPVGFRLHGTYQWLRGRRPAAEWLWRRSVEVAERLGAKYELGLAYQEIGMRTGRRLHLEQARAIFDQIGARRDLAYVQERLERAG